MKRWIGLLIGALALVIVTGQIFTAQPGVVAEWDSGDLVFKDAVSKTAILTIYNSTDGVLAATLDATAFKIGGVSMSATAAQLNYLYGVTAGTAAANKAVVLNTAGNVNVFNATTLTGGAVTGGTVTTTGSLVVGSTTLSSAEVAVLDAVSAGTAVGGKAVVLNTAGNVNVFNATTLNSTAITGGTVTTSGSLVVDTTTISAAEIGVLDAVSAGTAAGGKAVVLDTAGNIDVLNATALESSSVSAGDLSSTGTATFAAGAISLAALNGISSGTLTIASGDTSNTVTLSGVNASSKIVATISELTSNAVTVRAIVKSTGSFMVHLTGDPGGSNADVDYIVIK
uniref:Uncharacterized protein n=1 Tax=viral metagenome TaxID=1070528 RepID=A0A6M3LBK8_9ZZZZ